MEEIDAEYAEYITRAKTRDTLARLAKDRTSSARSAGAGAGAGGSAAPPANDPDNPVITVHIQSRLDSTQPIPPMSAKLRFMQQLRVVRKSFLRFAREAHRLEVSDAECDGIILTWCGNRVYDITTPMSLAARPDDQGLYVSQRSGRLLSRETEGFYQGGLRFEAWQLDIYERFLHEREKRLQRALDGGPDGVASDDDMSAGEPGSAAAGAAGDPEPAKLRLTLKPKALEPLNMTARPDTTVATLIQAFRKQRNLDTATNVALYWDGERLEEDMPLADTEIEDEDTIEVHIN